MEPSWETVSAQLQPVTAGHARLVLNKTVPFFSAQLCIYSATGLKVCCSRIQGKNWCHFPIRFGIQMHRPLKIDTESKWVTILVKY